MAEEENSVRWATRDADKDFWYARVGPDAIVAARVGSAANDNMERIRKALVVTDSPKGFYHPQGQFEIMEEVLDVLAPRDGFPGRFLVDIPPSLRRRIVGRYRQLPGSADMIVQHGVCGERLFAPDKVHCHGRA